MGASGFLLAVLDKCTKPPHNNLKVSLVLSFSSLSYSSDGDAPIANLKRQTRRPAIASDKPSDDKEDKTLSELSGGGGGGGGRGGGGSCKDLSDMGS